MYNRRNDNGDHRRCKREGQLVGKSAFKIPLKVGVIPVMFIGHEKFHITEKAPKHQADKNNRAQT